MFRLLGLGGMLTSVNSCFDLIGLFRGNKTPQINVCAYIVYLTGVASQFAYCLQLNDAILYIPMGLDVIITLLVLLIISYRKRSFVPHLIATFHSDLHEPIYHLVPVSEAVNKNEVQHSDLNVDI